MRTPGPWTWDEQDGYVVGPPGAGVVAYDVGQDEDGRLMAAAAELLEALERMTTTSDADNWDQQPGGALRQAYDAIAKARGESESAPNQEAEGASR